MLAYADRRGAPAVLVDSSKSGASLSDFDACWFHGHISRDDAERRLMQKHHQNGAYLIRESTNFPGDHTLCLLFAGKVEHYRIAKKKNQYTCDDEEFFDTLHDLVEHYTLDADGLCNRLVAAVARPTPSISHSTTASLGRRSPQATNERRTAPKSPASHLTVEQRDMIDGAIGVAATAAGACDDWRQRLKQAGFAIDRRQLRLGDTIGRGEFGDVLVGILNEKKVAVKVLKEADHVVKSFLQEALLMASLQHKNLVQLLGVVFDSASEDVSNLFIVLEFMANGNLVDYLRTRGRQQVTGKQQIHFACDTCAGMAYLESKNLVHRDLAARNVLLSEDMVAQVSDFGLAKKVDLNLPEDASGKFPIKWTAPEALRYNKFTNKSDVWSYGVFLWEIYSFGRVPYPRIAVQDVVRHVEKGYRMEAPEGCPLEAAHLMSSCWEIDPQKRPTFKQLFQKLQTLSVEFVDDDATA